MVSGMGVWIARSRKGPGFTTRLASIDSARRRKVGWMWHLSGCVITSDVIRRGGVEVCGLTKDAGVMVPSDPS